MRRWLILIGVAAVASVCLAIPNPTLSGQKAGPRKTPAAAKQSGPGKCCCHQACHSPKKTSPAARQTASQDEAASDDADREAIALASNSVLPDQYDSAFARYVDLRDLGDAWATRDPAALTDVGLQLAEGERILLRPHRAMSASRVLALAARLAGERRDNATLARLARAARQLGNKELTAVVQAAEKQARTSRKAPPLLISAEDTTPESLAVFQSYLAAIREAKLFGDRQALEAIDREMPKRSELNAELRSYLKQLVTDARTAASEKPDSRTELLNRLAQSTDPSDVSMDIDRYRPPTYRPPTYRPPTYRPPSYRPPTVYHPPVHPRPRPRPPIHPRPRPPVQPRPRPLVGPRGPIVFPPHPRGPVIREPWVIEPEEVVIVPQTLPAQNQRHLVVANDSPETVELFVKYRTLDEAYQWVWRPAPPEEDSWLSPITIEPGAAVQISDDGNPIAASRVRMYARSASGREWLQFRNQDLWLVDPNAAGERIYYSATMGTYTFRLRENVAER